jgi:hypothetical protein
MPTLLDRSKTLQELANRLTDAAAEKRRFERLRTRRDQIRGARDELEAARKALRLMATCGIAPKSVPRASSALRGKAPVVRAQLSADWRAVAEDQSLKSNLIDPVTELASKLRKAALEAWEAHVDAGQPPIRDSIVNALASAGFRTQCARLQEARTGIASLRRACPTSLADFERLDALKADVQRVWGELDDVPEDVATFLRKAARREAAIGDLTPGIRAWLDDRGMLGQLRVGLG